MTAVETLQTISASDPHQRRSVAVDDAMMSFVDTGAGLPVVFLHGNPTSSYLWRNVIPHVSGLARCLAPDLIGMGRSGPSGRGAYRFFDHAAYLDAWFDALQLADVILVVHDWGSALGFYRAQRFPEQIRAIVHMESIAQPLRWDDFGPAGEMFRSLRSPLGEQMIFEQNFFVERILPSAVVAPLSEAVLDHYREPFRDPESRRPTLAWPREIPIDGEPADVHRIVESYASWMAMNTIPKLLILGEPGAIVTGRTREFCRTWYNQEEVTVVGRHFLQEDSPDEIGEAIGRFILSLDGVGSG